MPSLNAQPLYASPIEQLWQTAALVQMRMEVREITYTIDRNIKRMILPQKRTFPTPTLTQKLFSNMKRGSKGCSGVDIPLFPTMLTTPESSPSRITSSPSLSPQTHPSTSQPQSTPSSNQTTPVTKEAALMPHESPL
ncbi:hypothetical protein Tco_0097030 [Tanacetum coccineum]